MIIRLLMVENIARVALRLVYRTQVGLYRQRFISMAYVVLFEQVVYYSLLDRALARELELLSLLNEIVLEPRLLHLLLELQVPYELFPDHPLQPA
jgi:hypothetical protein